MSLRDLFRPRAFIDANWVMVTFASALHLSWAVIISGSRETIQATPLWGFAYFIDSVPALAAILATCAVSAVVGGRYVRGLWGLAMMLPQQMLLFISSASVLTAVAHSRYADGTARHVLFILADQMPILLAAPLYTVAILTVYNRKRANE